MGRGQRAREPVLTYRMWIIITAVGGVIFGAAVNAYTIATRIATVPYVDAKFEQGIKYTDGKTDQVLQSAIAHSDLNRQMMLTEIREQGADVKAIAAKQDILLDSVRALQEIRRR
jgi:hypothetical protein